MGEPFLIGPNLVYNTLEKVHILRNRLKIAYSRKKSDVDHRLRDLEFGEGDKVYLEILSLKGVVRFSKKGKLSTYYVGPYDILQMVGKVAYELMLPSELASVHPVFHVSMLKKCIGDPESILPIEGLFVILSLFFLSMIRCKFLIGKSGS